MNENLLYIMFSFPAHKHKLNHTNLYYTRTHRTHNKKNHYCIPFMDSWSQFPHCGKKESKNASIVSNNRET